MTAATSGSRCGCAPAAPCSVLIGDLDLRVEFAAGEELRTEISAKFTREPRQADLRRGRACELDRWFTDADGAVRRLAGAAAAADSG